jgi:uncharacterized protein
MTANAPVLLLVCAVLACGGSTRVAPEPPAAPAPAQAPAQVAPARTPKFLDIQVPKLQGRVNDHAGLFSPAEASNLTAKLAAHEEATGQQFAVLTWKDLEGRAIEDVSFTVANTWNLGDAKDNDGLLIFVASHDRAVRIEVGIGLEQAIPDELAARIISEQIVPAFRRREYAAGIDAALDQLTAAARPSK